MSKTQILTFTEAALNHISQLLDKRGRPSFGIRICIKTGGCSGQTYYLEYADERKPFDEVVEQSGIRIIIDGKSLMYLIGSQMDYIEETFKSGFTFSNPNQKGQCGCGKSFSV